METKKEKRVVQIEIDDDVKKLTIEGVDKDQQVVMREELGEDELDQVAGGVGCSPYLYEDERDGNVYACWDYEGNERDLCIFDKV